MELSIYYSHYWNFCKITTCCTTGKVRTHFSLAKFAVLVWNASLYYGYQLPGIESVKKLDVTESKAILKKVFVCGNATYSLLTTQKFF